MRRKLAQSFGTKCHRQLMWSKEDKMTKTAASPFRLGVSLTTLDPEQCLETIGVLTGSMVKSVELWEPTFEKGEGHIADARCALDTAGVEPRTVHANFGGSIDISSLDNSVRSAGVQAVGVALDLAGRVGARVVIVHPSSEPIDEDTRAERMKQASRSIATLAERAGQIGCQIAIELLPRTCLGRSAKELLDLVEGVDASIIGVCLDTNHLMNRFASLPAVVRKLGPRLLALHCSDYDGVDEKHWPPLRGVIDWAAFLATLSAVDFSGPLHYEVTLDGQTPAERLAFLEASFSQLVYGTDSIGDTKAEQSVPGDAQ